jgi:hypothetical protein
MRNVNYLLILAFVGCNAPEVSQSLTTQSVQTTSTATSVTTQEPTVSPTPSPTPTPVYNKFLYVLVAGKVCAFPIDSTSKDIIQPQYGSWCVAPTSSASFFSMVIDSSGKYLYASSSTQSKIYQYSISQNVTYTEYGSNIPLNALANPTFATNVASSYMSFGSNGNLYIMNNNYSPARLDKLAVSAAGQLSLVGTITAAAETTTYGMNFNHITSINSGIESYVIDSGSNRILHYTDGVLQQSFQLMIAGTLTAIQIQ